MSLEITLDKSEAQQLCTAFAKVLQECARLPAPLALQAAGEVLQTLIDEYGGARVYFQSSKARIPADVYAQIEQALRAGQSCREAAKLAGVSHTTVVRVRRLLAERPTLAVGLGAIS